MKMIGSVGLGLYGFHFLTRKLTELVGWRVWAKAHGTHIFLSKKIIFQEKK